MGVEYTMVGIGLVALCLLVYLYISKPNPAEVDEEEREAVEQEEPAVLDKKMQEYEREQQLHELIEERERVSGQ